jgi:hypothetical protein
VHRCLWHWIGTIFGGRLVFIQPISHITDMGFLKHLGACGVGLGLFLCWVKRYSFSFKNKLHTTENTFYEWNNLPKLLKLLACKLPHQPFMPRVKLLFRGTPGSKARTLYSYVQRRKKKICNLQMRKKKSFLLANPSIIATKARTSSIQAIGGVTVPYKSLKANYSIGSYTY